ncbi:MAG TPA: hypothetical protein VLH35_01445 [Candidatus Acidoferrales bacterium]|nr:hypothetical protein [Candidatus Acidoferrales bacterium]
MAESSIQFSTSIEAKRWLESQTSTTLSPVHAQAKRLRDEMNMQILALTDVSNLLLDVSTKEIEKRNMKVYNRARALNKLARLFLDRLKKITPPEQVTYDSINRYAGEVQKVLLVTDIDVKNWFPRISPFFIMDRRKFLGVYEKARQTYNTLTDHVNKEYVKTKTLEEALQQLNELQNLERNLQSIQQDKNSIRDERVPIEQEIAELEQKIVTLQTQGPIDKLNLVNAEIENLSNEVKNAMRHLQKPFIKMQAMATFGGGGGIAPDELTKITQYLDKPFDALVEEQTGYPVLRAILEKLETMIAKDTLKLKPDKARKANESANEILRQNTLDSLQVRCKAMATNRDHLLASAKLDENTRNIAQYQEQLVQLKARKTSVESHESVKASAYQETVDKLNSLKRTAEKNILAALGKRIQIA